MIELERWVKATRYRTLVIAYGLDRFCLRVFDCDPLHRLDVTSYGESLEEASGNFFKELANI